MQWHIVQPLKCLWITYDRVNWKIYNTKLHTDHALKVESTQDHQEKMCQYGHDGVLGLWFCPLILHTFKFLYNKHIPCYSQKIFLLILHFCIDQDNCYFPSQQISYCGNKKSDSPSLSEDEWVYPGTLRQFIYIMILEELCPARNVASVGACKY